MALLWCSVLLTLGLAEASLNHDNPVVTTPNQKPLTEDPEEIAKEWMEQLEHLSDTLSDAANFFENKEDKEDSSNAWSHSFKLAGSIFNLVSGFLGSSHTKEYIKAIQELQKEFDQAIAVVLTELQELVKDITADFLKTFLVDKVVKLQDSITALTEFTKGNYSDTDKLIWHAQMEPIGDRVDAWNAVVLCLTSQLTSCPSNALDIILSGGASWPRPAILVQFAAYHYSLLASSATAICTYEASSTGTNLTSGCNYIDLTKLTTVASTLSKSVTDMKTGWFSSLGHDMLPSLISEQISQNPDGEYDGAETIATAVGNEIDAFYMLNGLGSFFSMTSYAIVLQTASGDGGNWEAYAIDTGGSTAVEGYDVRYMFTDKPSYYYDDNACIGTDDNFTAYSKAVCLNDLHGGDAWVLQGNRRRCSTFSYVQHYNYAYHLYSDESPYVRVVGPGYGSEKDNRSRSRGFGWKVVDTSPSPEELQQGFSETPPVMPRGSDRSNAAVVTIPRDIPHSPSDIMKDIANAFETAGAIADFFGPEGEAVGIVLDVVGEIFNIIGGLLGLGQPDPVIKALRDFEKDIMGKLTEVSDVVQQAKSTAQMGAISVILNNAEVPLLGIVDSWNLLYPNGSINNNTINQEAAEVFKDQIGGNIAKYRDAWNILVECLAATSVDCVLQGKTALEILRDDGQTYARPRMLTYSLKYYFILLQKSAVAICAYARLFLKDSECAFMPNLKTGLNSTVTKMKAITTSMKDDFWASLGSDMLPDVLRYFVEQNPNGDYDGAKAIGDSTGSELDYWHFADGLDEYFGVTSYCLIIKTEEGQGGNWQSYSIDTGGEKNVQGYDVHYMFTDKDEYSYDDNDCVSDDAEDMAQCLSNMHSGDSWVFLSGRRRFNTFSYTYHSDYAFKDYSDEFVRVVGPGYNSGQGKRGFGNRSRGFGWIAVDTSPSPEELQMGFNETPPVIVI